MDNKPFVNIMPFGLCTVLANPITAAQTAAALGVLTPGACIPVDPGAVGAGVADRAHRQQAGARPTTSKCICAYGGMINVSWARRSTETGRRDHRRR